MNSPIKQPCPTCGKMTFRKIINEIGECLNCDHIRGQINDDMREEALAEEGYNYLSEYNE